MCNDRLGRKHLGAQGAGLERTEIRQELTARESDAESSQRQPRRRGAELSVSLLSLPELLLAACPCGEGIHLPLWEHTGLFSPK